MERVEVGGVLRPAGYRITEIVFGKMRPWSAESDVVRGGWGERGKGTKAKSERRVPLLNRSSYSE
jgi:hypothetical protein